MFSFLAAPNLVGALLNIRRGQQHTHLLVLYCNHLGHNQGMGIWQELRRRRVYRMSGFYVVGAWLIIQVADVFFPAWGLPETALRFLIIATMLCFPIALVFSWTFDITTSGIVKTEPADPGEVFDNSLKRTDYIVLVALLAIGAAIVFGSLQKIIEEVDDAVYQQRKNKGFCF